MHCSALLYWIEWVTVPGVNNQSTPEQSQLNVWISGWALKLDYHFVPLHLPIFRSIQFRGFIELSKNGYTHLLLSRRKLILLANFHVISWRFLSIHHSKKKNWKKKKKKIVKKIIKKSLPFYRDQSRFSEALLVRHADGELKNILLSKIALTFHYLKKLWSQKFFKFMAFSLEFQKFF